MISSALLTDLYQLTMANGYFKLGMHNKQACFHQFFRRNPFGSAYTIAAGLDDALQFLESFNFSTDELDYLASLTVSSGPKLFDRDFLNYLRDLKLDCEVDAVLEGTVVFPKEPLLRVRGSLLHCQLLETYLLNVINFQSLIATKAARCVSAANGREVIDFGLRRAQGPDGALSASRAAFIGGCSSTSNVLAGKLFGVPVKGTQAHSWIMAFGDEKNAFRAFARAMPENVVLLVDTYHTRRGIENAIEVGREMKEQGQKLLGIRLDSGDLNSLSKMARSMLDTAGFQDTQIVASGDLDEYRIAELVNQDAPIDAFGVGTRMITAFDEPALSGVYKLSVIEDDDGFARPCLKISDDLVKNTLPGFLQTRRYISDNKIVADLIFDDVTGKNPTSIPLGAENTTSTDLLVNVFKGGARVPQPYSILEARTRTQANIQMVHNNLQVQIDTAILEKQGQILSEDFQ